MMGRELEAASATSPETRGGLEGRCPQLLIGRWPELVLDQTGAATPRRCRWDWTGSSRKLSGARPASRSMVVVTSRARPGMGVKAADTVTG